MAIYKVYTRLADGSPGARTSTESRAAAVVAFAELVTSTEFDGKHIAAVITCDGKQLAFHWFDQAPGSADYWRDRLYTLTSGQAK